MRGNWSSRTAQLDSAAAKIGKLCLEGQQFETTIGPLINGFRKPR